MSFEFANLAARYDRGLLVPFIGSGMSVPACASWKQMVQSLERHAGIEPSPDNDDYFWRCECALESIRFARADVALAVYESIGANADAAIPPQTALLASLYWPLVCTTNYDDVYLRAVMANESRAVPQIFGRSEVDCRRVLQHLNMPVHEAIWTLQGFLGGRNPNIKAALPADFDHARAEREIVAGHVAYRRAANRSPHFRRCFAELFRTRSLLFLGSGLTEPYFRSLFDEIIELSGPPAQPHFALLPAGSVDTDFLLRQYNIICRTYAVGPERSANRHQAQQDVLGDFCKFVRGERTRQSRWGYHLRAPERPDNATDAIGFAVRRQDLPAQVGNGEALAISCGRAGDPDNPLSVRGVPLPSRAGRMAAGIPDAYMYRWAGASNWTVQFDGTNSFGILARELIEPGTPGERPRDRRSPDAIRQAFCGFLNDMQRLGIRTAYVQLLAAGERRTFHPWVSLVQMARAYGEWHRDQLKNCAAGIELVSVEICAVDPDIFAVLQGNYIDLNAQLQDDRLSVTIEVINEANVVSRHHQIVGSTQPVSALIPNVERITAPYPLMYSLPTIRLKRVRVDFVQALQKSVRDFGLVSGSTLVLDFRPQASRAA